MLGALVLSFAMLAVNPGPPAAETTPPATRTTLQAADIRHDIDNKLPAPGSNSAAESSSGEDSAAESELLEWTNKSRELAGASRLRTEESLHEAALAHAWRMVQSEQLEHQLPGEPSLLERIALVSPIRINRAGENIAHASCAPGADDVLMRSAPHRQNLLDRGFNIAGFAAIWSKGRLYVVEDFAHEVPSYSAEQSGELVRRAVYETRQEAGLPELVQLTPPNLDAAACSLARENRPNAHLLATAYDNRKVIAYTESRPEVLPSGALRLLRAADVRQFAVGVCYARNAGYPTGMYWVAILLY